MGTGTVDNQTPDGIAIPFDGSILIPDRIKSKATIPTDGLGCIDISS
ncbi:MAG TPA: hypothetical protein P5228_07755 [Bacteroidales bacterium]|nr:hypothetical protein [Bacteroidales bacterium]